MIIFVLSFSALFSNDNVEGYLQKAEDKELHTTRYWHLLLHMSDGKTSEIDDPSFFLAPEGKTDAKAELDATIRALYDEEVFDDNATACRFPARKAWLSETLGLEGLPKVECRAYDKLIERLDPQSVTLVFPYAHINSPASMFGHTFLRIDSSYDSKLLSYAINYAAAADASTENGFMFAVKGLMGGYYGKYSLLPYYEKLKEYRDTEQRDIWEYDLDLTRDEVMRMMRHVWELNNTFSWYFFFDENCSYNMLWLIEVARPSVHLREYFSYQVIPPETVHAVEAEGIVKQKQYRPSKRSRLLAYETALDGTSEEKTLSIARGEKEPALLLEDNAFSVGQKRHILEAASELTEYGYIENDINKTTYLKRFHAILSSRSTLGKSEKIAIEEPANPDRGHQAVRTTWQSGWRNGEPVQFVGVRPAYHDVSDSDVGYLRGTQIEFLDVTASYSKSKARLEELTLLSIVSIAPRTAFFKPFSWRMKAGWDRNYLDEKADFTLGIGGGFGWGNESGYLYVMADPLFYSERKIVGGIGGSVGGVIYEGEALKTNIEATRRFYSTGEEQRLLNMSQHYRLSQNISLSISYEHVEKRLKNSNTAKIILDWFF